MTTNVWKIVWRDRATGNIVETAGGPYLSHRDADEVLHTLNIQRRDFTPTIEREIVDVPL